MVKELWCNASAFAGPFVPSKLGANANEIINNLIILEISWNSARES